LTEVNVSPLERHTVEDATNWQQARKYRPQSDVERDICATAIDGTPWFRLNFARPASFWRRVCSWGTTWRRYDPLSALGATTSARRLRRAWNGVAALTLVSGFSPYFQEESMSLVDTEGSQIMFHKPSAPTEAADDLALAREVTHDLPSKFAKLGATPEQAQGIADAVSYFLAHQPNFRELAAQALMRAGFKNGSVRVLLSDIAAALKIKD
jgi:hypothetical protein